MIALKIYRILFNFNKSQLQIITRSINHDNSFAVKLICLQYLESKVSSALDIKNKGSAAGKCGLN